MKTTAQFPSRCLVGMTLLVLLPWNAAESADVSVNWLGGTPPPVKSSVSWGVPWTKGSVQKSQAFTLKTADGVSLPLQSWPLAYWPDGSIKWSGFATVAGPQTAGPLQLSPGNAAPSSETVVQVTQSERAIEIDTGWLKCRIPRQGSILVDSMMVEGREIARRGRLECLLQKGLELDPAIPPPRERFISEIKQVTVEQNGPVRAVVRFDGVHKSESGAREWLPFHVRLYFSAGQTPVRMVHTIVFDGDEKQDFIRGLGIVFDVPMREEIQNRHVRFGGEGSGVWSEPIQPLTGWNRGVRGNPYPVQLTGARVPNRAELDAASVEALDAFPVWNDFRLIQPNADGFTIEKRTSVRAAWIPAAAAKRSSGLAFVGDVSGGLAVGLKDFWQAYPSGLEIRNCRSNTAELRAWLWTPDAPTMDLRHYDTVARPLAFTYEDAEPDLSTSIPYGVARTHELTLFPCAGVPTKQETSNQAQTAAAPPLLVCTPQYLHDVRAFGIWSVQDRSTPFKRAIEDHFDSMIAYYQKAIDQWNWYGFWDYGDVMHSYDAARHEWKYDVGGFAWDNSEQGTDMVLWYLFLRSGRPDIFRMAEAMTRHTGEVDCYHIGKLAGLGSRHNIRHWGCGAKEARISMAPYRRFYHYLTTDERTGDVMREMLQADVGVTVIDPMRKVIPPTEADKQFPARVRGGPDWFALVGNWMTEWERTGDIKWRDKIVTGMDSIASFPFLFRTSQSLLWGIYPETGKLVPRDQRQGGYNLVMNMGGPEIIFELNEMIDHPGWTKAWLDYCQNSGGGRLAGYMYRVTKDPAWAQRAMGALSVGGRGSGQFAALRRVGGSEAIQELEEGPNGLVTNGINQSSLQAIEVLDLIADQLPTEVPAQPQDGPVGGRGRRGGGGRGQGGQPAGGAESPPAN